MVEGWRIDVYAKDGRAEAIRMTKDWAQTKDLMRERGVIAVEQATGWLVDRRTISGDGALVRMRARAPRSGPAARSGAETDPPA
jgi:AmiR/NasT family two-component response regulator